MALRDFIDMFRTPLPPRQIVPVVVNPTALETALVVRSRPEEGPAFPGQLARLEAELASTMDACGGCGAAPTMERCITCNGCWNCCNCGGELLTVGMQ